MVDATTVLLTFITLLTAVFVWSRRTYVYWQRRRVPFVQPTHLLGNLKTVLKLENSFGLQLRDFYFDARFEGTPLVGIYLFHQPALLIRDLELVRKVLIEDFICFSNRFSRCDARRDKIGALSLFFVKNPEWHQIRTKLSPAFTNGKIRQMFALMEEIGYDLEVYLNKLTNEIKRNSSAVVQIKDICDLYNTDMIASIAFGMRSYSLRNTQTDIIYGRHLLMRPIRRAIDYFVIFFLPKLVPLLRPSLFSPEHANFLRRSIHYVLQERERCGPMRNDLIETLLTLKKEALLNENKLHYMHEEDFLAAQAAIFEVAGIQTCSTTMTFALYELARAQDIQQRLRAEIHKTFNKCLGNININYDSLQHMPYLSMVVDETLRKYPIISFLERECTPVNKKRFYSFRPRAECMARRGMPVFISNLAIHHDPRYWPEPEIFNPERFSPENKLLLTPMSYLPFGAGPHNCIGIALGLLQIKLGLVHFLLEHRVEPCEKTVMDIKFDPKNTMLSHDGGIYLRIVKCAI